MYPLPVVSVLLGKVAWQGSVQPAARPVVVVGKEAEWFDALVQLVRLAEGKDGPWHPGNVLVVHAGDGGLGEVLEGAEPPLVDDAGEAGKDKGEPQAGKAQLRT